MSGNSQMIRPSRPFQTKSFVGTLPLPLATILELRRELRRVSNLKLIYKLTPPCKKSSWGWLFDQVWYSKDEQRSSSDSWQRLPKPWINSLKYFSVFLLICKIRHAYTTCMEVIRTAICLPIFRKITEIVKEMCSSIFSHHIFFLYFVARIP